MENLRSFLFVIKNQINILTSKENVYMITVSHEVIQLVQLLQYNKDKKKQ